MIIDGRKIAKEIIDRLVKHPTPKRFLGVIIVGENAASKKFVEQKRKIAEVLNIDFRAYQFAESIEVDELRKKIGIIGHGKTCGGLIVQLPLPSHLDRRRIVNSMPKEKDLDVLSESAYGQFLTDQRILPPSVSTFCEVLSHYQVLGNVSHETFVVVGNGFLVGKPISDYLRLQGKQLVILDKGDDLSKIKDADVVILGTGVPNIVNEGMIKNGVLVIDFGCSFIDGKLCGDLLKPTTDNFFYTPTPGGTGPILVAKLFENFYKCNNVDENVI
ncbi:MAG: methylenetetrahydrofolate dehydrogenase (NADP+) / methenyltetrahydrofolate cyclohydrolase [Parcubacteria group bacterium LiPW_41]|nr:MAG: methylenetetrahydrofolate dehydrogenase (NADP+) / methenyltetrahydrofolate cyclohydrolase [Parcubacteria group bacterium LiPW_41]